MVASGRVVQVPANIPRGQTTVQQQPAHDSRDVGTVQTPPSSAPGSSLPPSSSPPTPRDSSVIKAIIKHDSPEPVVTAMFDEEVHMLLERDTTNGKPAEEAFTDIESPLFGLETASVLPYEEMLPDIQSDEDKSELDTGLERWSREHDHTLEPSRTKFDNNQPTGGLVQRIKHLLEAKSDLTGSTDPTWKSSRFDIEPRTHPAHTPRVIFQSPGLSAESHITRAMIKAAVSPSSTGLDAMPHDLPDVPQRDPDKFDISSVSSSEYSSTEEQRASREDEPFNNQDREVSELEGVDTTNSGMMAQENVSASQQSLMLGTQSLGTSSCIPSIDILAIRNGEDKEVVEVKISQHMAVGENHRAGEVLSESQATRSHSTSCEEEPPGSAVFDEKETVPPAQVDRSVDEILDINAGITSDIVTNIAARFSIPHQSTLPKANFVSTSSASERYSQTQELHKDIHELPSSTSPRGSLWGADAIPPLQVNKQQDLADTTTSFGEGANLSSFIRRSFPRRNSAFFGDRSTSQSDERDSRPRSAFDIYPTHSGRLPGVKEDSQEDVADVQQKWNKTSARLTSDVSASTSTQIRRPFSLSEIRNLPSLNFSQMNLIDQLNAALALRDSLGALGRRTSASVASPTPLRPASTDALRERYTSFFVKPEDFQVPDPMEEGESFSLETLIPSRRDVHRAQPLPTRSHIKESEHDDKGETLSSAAKERARSLSPTELLGMASEVEMLEVPSVAGLSSRLSALLPSLRPHLDSVLVDEEAVEQTIDEIHKLGQRPTTMLSARSSGVLRSLAAIADDIATNGTHSSALAGPKPRYNKKLPPLPVHGVGDEVDQSMLTTTEATVMSESEGSCMRDPTIHGLRRTRSEIRGSSTMLRPDIPSANQTRRSFTISTPNSRPWNYDKNYPWSAESGLVSIEFGQDGDVRESIASRLLREAASTPTRRDRAMKGAMSPNAEDTIEESSLAMEPYEFDPTATVTADTLTAHHTRKLSKKAPSLLESLSKRAKLVSPTRPSMESNPSTNRPGTAATMLSTKSAKSKAHAVGDRYPSTALQAPVGYDVDEMRSYFSDDGDSRSSSAQGIRRRLSRTNVIKKRLSGLRFRPEIRVRPASEIQDASLSGDERTRNNNRSSGMDFSMLSMGLGGDINALDDADEDATLPMGPQGTHVDGQVVPIGMSRVELRIKRLGERVRVALARGSELLRRMSAKRLRQDRGPSRQELHDVSARNSVYTGT